MAGPGEPTWDPEDELAGRLPPPKWPRGAAAAAAQPADSYDDDSILQALRRLPPEELIKHMLETEEWADRLANQAREWPAPPPSCRTRLRPACNSPAERRSRGCGGGQGPLPHQELIDAGGARQARGSDRY